MEQGSGSIFNKYSLWLIGLLFFSFYVLGNLYPELWWGTHFLSFLPKEWQTISFIFAGMFIFIGLLPIRPLKLPASIPGRSSNGMIWIVSLTLLIGLLIHLFPMPFDYYGDAYKVLEHLDKKVQNIPSGTHEAVLNPGISPWAGHSFVLGLVTYLAYFMGISYKAAFGVMGLLCGTLFVFIWLNFIRVYFEDGSWKIIMSLAGITAPFMLIFFGHIESYAPVFLLFLSWQILLLNYIKTSKEQYQWILLGLLLICIKFHLVALLFTPAYLIAILHHSNLESWKTRFKNWRGISKWILAPIFGLGLFLYFFVFQDHADGRDLHETAMEFDRLFLPIFSPDPPLNTYNLFSFNHIFDYFNEVLIWSPIALFTLVFLFIAKGIKISWNHLAIRCSGLSLILFSVLFFVINPLLSMPIDWDLMAIPATSFLVFAATLAKDLESEISGKYLLGPSVGIAILCLPIFITHHSPSMHVQRLEKVGFRVYHSYYQWSSQIFRHSLQHSESREIYQKRKKNILDKLEPYAQEGIDFEYSRMLISEGKYALRASKRYHEALDYLNKAYLYYPKEKNGLLYLMESHFMLQQFKEAFQYSTRLIDEKYPSEKKAYSAAIHCALEAELYKEAFQLSSDYLQQWDDNQTIRQVYNHLQQGTAADSLKYLFAGSAQD